MSLLEQKKETLKQELKQAVIQSGLAEEKEIPEILLEVPREKEHGDWATNLAMQLTKVARRNPREIAAKIVEHLDKEKNHIEKIEIAGPGFINFFLDRSFLVDVLDEIDRQKKITDNPRPGRTKK